MSAMAIDPSVENEAARLIERYFKAINAQDSEAVRAALHFPHFRVGASGAVAWFPDKSADFFANFTGRVGGDGWRYSVLDGVEALDTFPDKAHVRVLFRRFRADDSLIGAYRSLYVVTRQDGRWGIQGGSGNGS